MTQENETSILKESEILVTGSSSSTMSAPLGICHFTNCNLKSINGYDFCYRHIDMFDARKNDKMLQCEWIDEKNEGKRCTHLVIINEDLKDHESSCDQKNLCVTHVALEKLKNKRKLESIKISSQNSHIKVKSKRVGSSIDEDYEKYQKMNETKKMSIFEFLRDPKTKELLDSSDSLDEIMLNMIDTYQKNGDLENSDSNIFQETQQNSKNENKIVSSKISKIGLDYDHDLEHAGVYTKQEIVRIFKIKMSKLQLLYKKQMEMLSEKMRNEKKRFEMIKNNKKSVFDESDYSGSKSASRNLRTIRAVEKYRSLRKKELYFKKKIDPQHFDSPESIYNTLKSMDIGKCIYLHEAGERCSHLTIPLSKYCREHILKDPMQVLFSECGVAVPSIGTCKNPIIASLTPYCQIHLTHTIGCLSTLEASDLLKFDAPKLNCATQAGPPDYPPDSLITIAARLNMQSNVNMSLPSHLDVESFIFGIHNGTGLVRIKQEILDQSNLSSEDAVANESNHALAQIQVKEEEKEYVTEKGELEVILEEHDEPDRDKDHEAIATNTILALATPARKTTDSRSSYSSSTRSSSVSSTSSTSANSSSSLSTSSSSSSEDSSSSSSSSSDSSSSTNSDSGDVSSNESDSEKASSCESNEASDDEESSINRKNQMD